MKGRVVLFLLIGVIVTGVISLATPVTVEQTLDSEPGFGQYRGALQDFGWTHTLGAGIRPGWILPDATLTIKAWDVDYAQGERDLVYAEGVLLGALTGQNHGTADTVLTISDLTTLFGDGLLDIWLDIDSTSSGWLVTILESILRYQYEIPPPPVVRADIVSIEAPAGAGGATGAPGGEVQITIVNSGDTTYVGPCEVFAGLAYTTSWLPEAVTIFDTFDAGIVELVTGVPLTLVLPLAEIPVGLLDLFYARLVEVWTGYVDDDPQDYVGFFIRFDGLPTVVDYLPIP